MALKSFSDALEWLDSHIDYERVAPNRQVVPTLQPIHDFLAALGDPHRDFPSIHVTGTNGKGTTTTLISALLSSSGLRVGTVTSPDLHSVTERIAVAAEPIGEEEFTAVMSRLADVEVATGIVLTRFELLTVGAFLHFSDEGVTAAVIEVGLGGTWDSTNVIDGVVSVLTNVDLDHVAVLGPTIGDIARDKVGIFRSGAAAVLGTTNKEVVTIAQSACNDLGATLYRAGEQFELVQNDVAVGGRLVSVRTPFSQYDDVLLRLHGIHQGDNAATALSAAELFLGRKLGERTVRMTFAAATMPGRLEVLSTRPMIVVDGAHNPAGVQALANALDGAFYVEGERRCVIGMLTGRNVDDMVAPLIDSGVSEFFCAPPDSPRAMATSLVVEALRSRGATAYEFTNVLAAISTAREHSNEDDLIVAAGSLYLVGEVRALILGLEPRIG